MSLNWKRSGEGPPVILLHGLFGSLENLGAIARELATAFSVYSVDLPNHGKSPHTPTMSISAMAEDIASFMSSLELQEAAVLGHSLGGKVAMELALTHPQWVRSLVVMDIAPISYPRQHDTVFAGLQAIAPEELTSRADAEAILAAYVDEPAVRSFLLKNLIRNKEGRFQWRMNLPVLRQSYDDLLKANKLAVFAGPVLFLKGSRSDYLQEKDSESIQSRFPAAQLKIVYDTGHWLHAEKPQFVANLVKRFLLQNTTA